VPEGAFNVHGLSAEFLKDKPLFKDVATGFMDFIEDSPLIIHNAAFDTKFLNFELQRIKRKALSPSRIVDTLQLARRKHPGTSNSLDALCDRYNIDRSKRVKHGALLDSEILAEVYSELLGGKQSKLDLNASNTARGVEIIKAANRTVQLEPLLTENELAHHQAFVATLGETAIWGKYIKGGLS
jgi:DNA polymerase III subunit epsilon